MTDELKTLKDFERDESAVGWNNACELLKQEAIKWVKQLEIDFTEKPLLKPQNNREYWIFTEYRQFLMDRFNITEEDLK